MKRPTKKSATFFATQQAWRAWLEKHHETASELVVGFYKTDSGKPSITWPQSVDEALCFGWIDAVRHGIDDECYTIRFTKRKPTSIWSAKNVARIEELRAAGQVAPAGEAAYARRTAERTAVYSFERNEAATLPQGFERKLRANKTAAAYFDAQPPWYRRTSIHWVISAKREATRESRLATLIECSARGEWIGPLKRR